MNIKPTLAAVAPRILSCGVTIPAVDMLADILESTRDANIAICGEKGWGKSAALAHLAAKFPNRDDVLICDSHKLLQSPHVKARVRVFPCGSEHQARELSADCWTLAEWGLDEALEYLMNSHRSSCERLMPMLKAHASSGLLPRRPVLWRMLLETMVDNGSIATFQEGLDRIVRSLAIFPVAEDADLGPATATALEFGYRSDLSSLVLLPYAKAMLLDDDDSKAKAVEPLLEKFNSSPSEHDFAKNSLCLLTEPAIYIPVAVTGFVEELVQESLPRFLTPNLTKKLNARTIEHVARRIANVPYLLNKLKDLVGKNSEWQSMAASVLCSAVTNWRPENPIAFLRDGHFDSVRWDNVTIGNEASNASFHEASLNGASLAGCLAVRTCFSRARLCEADLSGIVGREADFSDAILRCTKFGDANLRSANFAGADCSRANFQNARLQDTDLRDASFVSANLRECRLAGANLEGTDFTLADFSRAAGRGLDFRQALLLNASFSGARLIECNFERQTLPAVDFIETNLSGANFSDTVIENGSFFGANLSNARLGDINWEHCDLRNVNLRGATFHYGSTRSGLVGSPYPSHGTRTGFYTDDFYDQPFKAPEEIRKANLRGSDLRGANISNVDFYLVDLREARLDREQAEHVRRCGAILEARV